jgi:hypothetical protein
VSRAAHGDGRLEALLQEQRSALREGKFEVLSSLAARLEKVTGSEAGKSRLQMPHGFGVLRLKTPT